MTSPPTSLAIQWTPIAGDKIVYEIQYRYGRRGDALQRWGMPTFGRLANPWTQLAFATAASPTDGEFIVQNFDLSSPVQFAIRPVNPETGEWGMWTYTAPYEAEERRFWKKLPIIRRFTKMTLIEQYEHIRTKDVELQDEVTKLNKLLDDLIRARAKLQYTSMSGLYDYNEVRYNINPLRAKWREKYQAVLGDYFDLVNTACMMIRSGRFSELTTPKQNEVRHTVSNAVRMYSVLVSLQRQYTSIRPDPALGEWH
jgi:hypothetical protein